jgi:hypothetical protein
MPSVGTTAKSTATAATGVTSSDNKGLLYGSTNARKKGSSSSVGKIIEGSDSFVLRPTASLNFSP